jgi:Protein of unknown function (DUF3891)
MLYREETQRRIAITQPTHAWLSGQLARAWGNEHFGAVVPWEEVCLGAEQHDVGHTTWEQAPTLNPQTGLPFSFLEMPRHLHLRLWSSAGRLVLPQGRYAALLVSLHGTGLYERYDAVKDPPETAQAVQNYLAQERAFQEELLTTLRADPTTDPTRQRWRWRATGGSSRSGMPSPWPFALAADSRNLCSTFPRPRVPQP